MIILAQDRFLNLTIWKAMAQAFQNTLTVIDTFPIQGVTYTWT